jgi:enamine deaminase RidA (YjgF/YER057c/UK114 family)
VAGRIDARLAELNIVLPPAPVPVATYVPFVRTGDLVFVSGQVAMREGKVAVTGKLGTGGLDLEQGKAAARMCFLSVLAQLRNACDGDLDRVAQVVRLGGFVAASADFTQHAQVMNGASDLAEAIFGEAGRHARTTIGVPSLPLDAAVEVEGLFRIA